MSKTCCDKSKFRHWYKLTDGGWIFATKPCVDKQYSDKGDIIEIHFDDDTEICW